MKTEPNFYAVVGGGITGLAAARKLSQLDPHASIVLFEASGQFGGVLQTDHVNGFVVEQAADMFISNPPFAIDLWSDLCREQNIDQELLMTLPVRQRAFIGLGERVAAVPDGFSMMVPSLEDPVRAFELMSEDGKLRLFDEVNQPPGNGEDESLESFAVRRFGREAFDVLIQPLISGVYTADPKKLSMRATMKRFLDMEQQHGSLIKASHAAKDAAGDQAASGARYNLFRSPADGINGLISLLVQSLTQNSKVQFRSGAEVVSITRSDTVNDAWQIAWTDDSTLANIGETVTQVFDGVVIATPARIASSMLAPRESTPPLTQTLVESLAEIETASSAIVVLGVDKSSLRDSFPGYGIIYPHIDNGKVIALSFSSNKFDVRAPDGKLLIRCFIGGALQSELVEESDEVLLKIATSQLKRSVGFDGRLDFHQVYRWRKCMPQYHLGHLETVDRIEAEVSKLKGLAVAGNSYRGVGIPACIESGQLGAEKVFDDFQP